MSTLKGVVDAESYHDGQWRQCIVQAADLRSVPNGPVSCQIVFGERFRVIEDSSDGSFGQSERDGYVGYVSAESLGDCTKRTHWVKCVSTIAYPKPDVKTSPIGWFPFGARLEVVGATGSFYEIKEVGFVPAMHLYDESSRPSDLLNLAKQFLGVPYLWGGNGPLGIDCSGLVQMTLLAVGYSCPRDSDMQWNWMSSIGKESDVQADDFAFWNGHVGIVDEGRQLVHATAHSMQVVCESLDVVRERIASEARSEFLGFARLPEKNRQRFAV